MKYHKLLEEVAELGRKTGYNTTPQLTVFNWAAIDEDEYAAYEEPTAHALEICLLEAATNNCKTRLDELLFSVRIGQPEILEHVLENGPPTTTDERILEERVEKALALEASLKLGHTHVVESLISFNTEAGLVFPETLFESEENKYGVMRDLWIDVEHETMKQKLERAGESDYNSSSGFAGLFGGISGRVNGSVKAVASVASSNRVLPEPGEEVGTVPTWTSRPSTPFAAAQPEDSLAVEADLAGTPRPVAEERVDEIVKTMNEETLSKLTVAERQFYLKRLDRKRTLTIPQDPRWIQMLTTLVDGYDTYIDVRCNCDIKQRAILGPTWVDLMLWAVLAGQHDLTAVLWRKSRFPMRAALLCSTLCGKIAEQVDGEAQKQELLEQFERYEQWALDVLESCKTRQEAMGMLAVVPGRQGVSDVQELALGPRRNRGGTKQEDRRA